MMRKNISLVGIALSTIRVHENHSLHPCVWISKMLHSMAKGKPPVHEAGGDTYVKKIISPPC
jgi:hypothetical protein